MPAPTNITTKLDQSLLTGVNSTDDEVEGLAPTGPPNYHAIKDAISSGAIDPMMEVPLPTPITMDYFMESVRGFELKPNTAYAMFVPTELFDKIDSLLAQLNKAPWTGVILPAKFYPDGEVEILVGTLEQHLGWLEGNK